jgi:predicted Rossmann fold nucleotide-binding protein DprA/Smf involved in DNA uptake
VDGHLARVARHQDAHLALVDAREQALVDELAAAYGRHWLAGEEGRQLAAGSGRVEAALAALGDPTRLGIVDLLQEEDLSPDALAEALGVTGNLLAHHLKVLEAAGLITRSREAQS